MKGKGIKSEEEIREERKECGWREYTSRKREEDFESDFYIGAMMALSWVLGEEGLLSADVDELMRYDEERKRK